MSGFGEVWRRPGAAHLLGAALSQSLRAVGPLAALPLAAHALGTAAFGRLAACVYAAQVIAVAVDGGVAATGYGLLERTAQSPDALFRHLTTLKLGLGVLLVGVGLAGAAALRVDLAATAGAGLYGAALSLNGFWWLNHRRRTALTLASEAAPAAGLLAGSATLAFPGAPWWTPLLGGGAGAALVPLALAARAGGGGFVGFVREELRPWSQLQVGVARLLVAAYGLALVPLAALRFDLKAVGTYAACDKVASVAGLAGLVAAQAAAPRVARGALSGGGFGASARTLVAAGLGAGAAYLLAAALGGGAAVRWLYGPRYEGLGGGAFVTFAADGLVGLNTLIWSGVLLPLERRAAFAWATMAGAVAGYGVLFAPLRLGWAQISGARLAGELAVLAVSLPVLLSLRRRPLPAAGAIGAGAAA